MNKELYSIICGVLVVITLSLLSCGPHGVLTKAALNKIKPEHEYNPSDTSRGYDYKDKNSWLLTWNDNEMMPVDIFYIHATTYKENLYWNMPYEDSATLSQTYQRSIRRKMSIFDDLGNMFAPKYRQATFYSFIDTKGNGDQAVDLASKDVQRAFNYYLKYLNKGRPFILASHSQGSRIAMDILPLIFNDSIISSKLIAAYVVGWPISEDYLKDNPNIQVCKDSLQTNCIISWNTETKHSTATIVDKRSLCINPLSWSTNEEHVSSKNNKGAVFYLNEKPDTINEYIGAQCKNGVLIVDQVPNKDYLDGQYGFGLLHRFDYNFFYLNTKYNAQQRIESYFLRKNP